MGRKPTNKKRTDNPEIRAKWIKQLSPKYLDGSLIKSTTSDIAKELNVSKATLYKYFESRKQILEAVVDFKIQEVAEFEEALFDQSIPYEQRYFQAVQVGSVHLAGISNNFLLDLKDWYPELWKKVFQFMFYATDKMREFYEQGIQQGILNDFDPKLLALTDRVFITALSDPQFLIDNELSLHHAINDYFLIKSKGIFKKE